MPDLVYYFSVHHESMSRGDRIKNVQFMAHAIARQRTCNCLAVGILGKYCVQGPAIAYAEPEGGPIIRRNMSSIAVTIADAVRWLASL
jgi:hypothetical protein